MAVTDIIEKPEFFNILGVDNYFLKAVQNSVFLKYLYFENLFPTLRIKPI